MAHLTLTVAESAFGTLPDGRPIRRFDLGNGTMTASLLEYVLRACVWERCP